MSFMLRKPPVLKEKLKRRSRRVEVLTVWVGFVAGISKIGSNNMLQQCDNFKNNIGGSFENTNSKIFIDAPESI